MNDCALKVLIVGGGLGGLCLAQGLKQAGISCEVFERDRTPSDRSQGFRIQINPVGDRALHACLTAPLYEAYVATAGRPVEGITFATERLERLLAVPASDMKSDGIGAYRSVSRITLRQILLEGLGDVVRFDRRFVGYERLPSGTVAAHFEDGSRAVGSLLVGADGVHSAVRRQFLPDADVVDTGVLGIAAKIALTDAVRDLLADAPLSGSTLVLGPQGRSMWIARQEFAHSPAAVLRRGFGGSPGATATALLDDTEDYAFWGFFAERRNCRLPAEPEAMDGPALRQAVLEMIRDWHPRIQRLVRESDAATVRTWPMRRAAYMDRWPTTNVTLLGDAIHSMPPTGGIGGNTALHDAQVLTGTLASVQRGNAALSTAVGDYESQMFTYAFDAVRSSMRLLHNATSDGLLSRTMTRTFFRLLDRSPALRRRLFQN